MGFNIFKKLGGDTKLVNEGTWVDETQGLKLLIARWNNKAHRKMLRKSVTAPKSKLDKFKVDMDSAYASNMEAVAKTVLLGWSGMEETLEDGSLDNDVKYSPEKALEYFEKYPEFYDMVVEYAQDISIFKAKEKEKAKGN